MQVGIKVGLMAQPFYVERGDYMGDIWEISCFTQLNGEIETECSKETVAKKEESSSQEGGEKSDR